MAATAADTSHPLHPTVAESAGSCLRSFQQCVEQAASVHPRELSLVEDQRARFSVWTANIGVFAPSRASLDHRLREASDVQDAVIGLLEALAFRILSCSNSLESLSTEESQRLNQPLAEIDPRFDQSIQGIASEISLLHRFSNTIRRASKESHNLKAADSFRIRDDEGNDAEDFLTKLFANIVRDRFPEVSDNIRQRLAITMVLRRKRILYRRFRYGGTTIRPQETPSQPQFTAPKVRLRVGTSGQRKEAEQPEATTASKSAIQSLAQSATTLAADKFQRASAPSVVSVSKTVALSVHEDLAFPPAPLGSIKRKYKLAEKKHREEIFNSKFELALDNQTQREDQATLETKLKLVLKIEWNECVKAIGEVTCPFCFYALPAQDVVDDKKWKLHVKNDLDAYVCMFEDCSSPHELYSHSSTWLKHMREHATRWRCTSKSHGEVICMSRDDYLTHMKTTHPGKFSEAQLRVLADRNGRVIGPLFRSCPLCGKEEVDGTMDDHVVGHLRFLALKSLPTYEDDGPENSESKNGSSSASRPQSRSTIKKDPERRILVKFDVDGAVENYWHTSQWGTPQNQSKYSAFGGFYSYVAQYSSQHTEGHVSDVLSPGDTESPRVFLPPTPDEEHDFDWLNDPSFEFVDASLFDGIPDTDRRQFEWGFIPNPHETSGNSKSVVLQCRLCSRKFDRTQPYEYHVHGLVCTKQPQDKRGFPFSCQFCGAGFNAKAAHGYHIANNLCGFHGIADPILQTFADRYQERAIEDTQITMAVLGENNKSSTDTKLKLQIPFPNDHIDTTYAESKNEEPTSAIFEESTSPSMYNESPKFPNNYDSSRKFDHDDFNSNGPENEWFSLFQEHNTETDQNVIQKTTQSTRRSVRDKGKEPLHGSDRPPGIASSFSDIDDALVTESDLRIALLKGIPNDQIRICIVDDNVINQKIALASVQNMGFKADAYQNGLEAVEGIRQKAKEGTPYHVVMMDLQMPVLDGYEATKLLRKDPIENVRNVPVIAMEFPGVEGGSRRKCLSSGMDDYLVKPIETDVLKRKLKDYFFQYPTPPDAVFTQSTREEMLALQEKKLQQIQLEQQRIAHDIAQLGIPNSPLSTNDPISNPEDYFMSSRLLSNDDEKQESKYAPGTTVNEHKIYTINEEIIQLNEQQPNLTWKSIDMQNLILCATLPAWGAFGVTIHIPREYPQGGVPQFSIERNLSLMSHETHEKLERDVKDIARQLLGRNSLGAVFSYLLGDGETVSLPKHQSDSQDAALQRRSSELGGVTKGEKQPVPSIYEQELPDGGGKANASDLNDQPLNPAAKTTVAMLPAYTESDILSSDESTMNNPRHNRRPSAPALKDDERPQPLSMDPNCSICHLPFSSSCDCETKAMEVAFRQAENKVMKSVYRDIRAWVRGHAQGFVWGEFSKYKQEVESDGHEEQAEEDVTGREPSKQEKINERWQTAVQSYPETLEYFYSLVQLSVPADNDPAVKDLPWSTLNGARRKRGSSPSPPPLPPPEPLIAAEKLCPTCQSKNQKSYVLPGRDCPYCGTYVA